MAKEYLNKKLVHFLHNDVTNPVTLGETGGMTFLAIEIGFAVIAVTLMLCLVLFCIMAVS